MKYSRRRNIDRPNIDRFWDFSRNFLKINFYLLNTLRTSLYFAPLRIMAAKCLRSDNVIVSFLFTFGAWDLILIFRDFCRDFNLIVVRPGKIRHSKLLETFKNCNFRQKFREKSCPRRNIDRPNIDRFFKFGAY